METYIDKVVRLVAENTNIKSKELQRYYALLVLTKGESITAADVHDGWAMSMNYRPQNKYCYGHDHYSLVPFSELSKETADRDLVYVKQLRQIAKEIKDEG